MTVLEQSSETKRERLQQGTIPPKDNRADIHDWFARQSGLIVERNDILFEDVPGGKVRIRVTVQNRGAESSQPTVLRLESAPLGAFVPWTPLTTLPVKGLQPGESVELVTEVARPHPTPLGSFDQVPPKKLLTAVNSPERRSAPPRTRLPGILAGWISDRHCLPPDLLELLGRANPYWAGNLNVFIGAQPVERHMAQALRIYPGRTNMAAFLVGFGARPDAYRFELAGVEPGWEAKLYDVTNKQSLIVGPTDVAMGEARWVEAASLVVMLAVYPPEGCEKGDVKVQVTRRSCGKTAIVEFNLDAAAQGAGCYTL